MGLSEFEMPAMARTVDVEAWLRYVKAGLEDAKATLFVVWRKRLLRYRQKLVLVMAVVAQFDYEASEFSSRISM